MDEILQKAKPEVKMKTKSKDYLRLFVKFLKEYDSLEKFKSNTSKIGYFDIKTKLEFTDPLEYFFIFPWKISPEGYDYWMKLYTKWYLFLSYDRSKNSKRFRKILPTHETHVGRGFRSLKISLKELQDLLDIKVK